MREAQQNPFANAPELLREAEFVRSLPVECRQVFTLRKVYGYSGKEIAIRLGIPEHAVEEHLIQAARRCAQAAPDVRGIGRRPSLLERLRTRLAHE
jgi:DNA-directed RNA polymerase specialized sigma24 family protein